jgi:hypothetical protein
MDSWTPSQYEALETKMLKSIRCSIGTGNLAWLPMLFTLLFSSHSRALELLTVHELVVHCEYLTSDPGGVDGQYCIRYIQGFIDGAVETDERIVQSLDAADDDEETFTERAMRTRMPRRGAYERPGSLAGFCLGDPLQLRQVVDAIVTDLVALDIGDAAESPARVAVEDSLRRHYPCPE